MENPYQCVCCNEILEFVMFDLHMQKCRNAPYRCLVCHQSFSDVISLQNHRHIHHGGVAPDPIPYQNHINAQQMASGITIPPLPPPSSHQNIHQQPSHPAVQSQHHLQQQHPPNEMIGHQTFTGQYSDMMAGQHQSQSNHLGVHHNMTPHPGASNDNNFSQQHQTQPPNYSITNQGYAAAVAAAVGATTPTGGSSNNIETHMNYHHNHHHHSAEEPYQQSHLSELMNFHTTGNGVTIKMEPSVEDGDKSSYNNSQSNLSDHSTQGQFSNSQQGIQADIVQPTENGSSNVGGGGGGGTTRSQSGKIFACESCERSFIHKHRYLRHIATHTNERPYQCKVCSKTFSQTYYLSRHTKTHTNEKPYQCEVCLKAFSQTYYLSRHLKTHSGERPYACNICQKTFVLNYSLRKHMRTHTNAANRTAAAAAASAATNSTSEPDSQQIVRPFESVQ